MSEDTFVKILLETREKFHQFFEKKKARDLAAEDLLLIEVLLGEIVGQFPFSKTCTAAPKDVEEMTYQHARKFMENFLKYKRSINFDLTTSTFAVMESMIMKILDYILVSMSADHQIVFSEFPSKSKTSSNIFVKKISARKMVKKKHDQDSSPNSSLKCVSKRRQSSTKLSSQDDIVFSQFYQNELQENVQVPDTIERYYRCWEVPRASTGVIYPATKTWLRKRKTYSQCPESSDSDEYTEVLEMPCSVNKRKSSRLMKKGSEFRLKK